MKDDFAQRTEVSGPQGQALQMNIIQYGTSDPVNNNSLSIPTTQTHDSGVERLTPVSSVELASESTEDNISDK
jgi:hypothetical protein